MGNPESLRGRTPTPANQRVQTKAPILLQPSVVVCMVVLIRALLLAAIMMTAVLVALVVLGVLVSATMTGRAALGTHILIVPLIVFIVVPLVPVRVRNLLVT